MVAIVVHLMIIFSLIQGMIMLVPLAHNVEHVLSKAMGLSMGYFFHHI